MKAGMRLDILVWYNRMRSTIVEPIETNTDGRHRHYAYNDERDTK
jgi:hypothetical protein